MHCWAELPYILDPSDMMSRYVFLTLFSFLWHDLLIVIGILCGTSAAMEDDVRGAVEMQRTARQDLRGSRKS